MNALQTIEKVLSILFPVRVPQIEGIVVTRKRTDRSPQYPPLQPGEDGIVGKAERPLRPIFRNGIERVQFEQRYTVFLTMLEEVRQS